jgi:hypothetical protein
VRGAGARAPHRAPHHIGGQQKIFSPKILQIQPVRGAVRGARCAVHKNWAGVLCVVAPAWRCGGPTLIVSLLLLFSKGITFSPLCTVADKKTFILCALTFLINHKNAKIK